MKKEFIRYGFFTLIALLIFIFIYPTIYRYDKYDQKIPVRINRINGKTEMLYSTGWTTATTAPQLDLSKFMTGTPSPAIDVYKREQSNEIGLETKEVVIGDLVIRKINLKGSSFTAEILNNSKREIDLSTMDIQTYDNNQSPLSRQPLSDILSGNYLNSNGTTVVSINMQAIPYSQVNWDELKQKQENSTGLKPFTPTTFSTYKINVNYIEK